MDAEGIKNSSGGNKISYLNCQKNRKQINQKRPMICHKVRLYETDYISAIGRLDPIRI